MELAFIIWAVGTLPSVSATVCFISSMICLVSVGAYCIVKGCSFDPSNSEEDKISLENIAKISKKISFTSLIIWFLFLLVPDKTTAYQMLAAYGVQSVAENPKVQEVASDGIDVLKALMKKAKEEIEKEDK